MSAPAPLTAQLAAILRNCPDEAALRYEVDLFKVSRAQEILRLPTVERKALNDMWTRHLARVRHANGKTP